MTWLKLVEQWRIWKWSKDWMYSSTNFKNLFQFAVNGYFKWFATSVFATAFAQHNRTYEKLSHFSLVDYFTNKLSKTFPSIEP